MEVEENEETPMPMVPTPSLMVRRVKYMVRGILDISKQLITALVHFIKKDWTIVIEMKQNMEDSTIEGFTLDVSA